MDFRRTYAFTAIFLLVSAVWSAVLLFAWKFSVTVCPFRLLTGLPCPSCGTGRAMVQLCRGDFRGAFMTNPIVFVLAAFGISVGGMMFLDLVFGKCTLPRFYSACGRILSRKAVLAVLLLLIAANWIWNLIKF